MDYEFMLKFKLPDSEPEVDAVIEKLGAAGCTDALVGVGIPGRVALNFTRAAKSAKEAVRTALRDVKKAIPDAELIEVGPDFVGITDVAEYTGVTRQNIRKLIVGHSKDFPPAIHDGSASVWHLVTVLRWFKDQGPRPVEPTLMEVAEVAMHLNITRQTKLLSPQLYKQLESFV